MWRVCLVRASDCNQEWHLLIAPLINLRFHPSVSSFLSISHFLNEIVNSAGSGHRMCVLEQHTVAGPLMEGGPIEEYALLGATGAPNHAAPHTSDHFVRMNSSDQLPGRIKTKSVKHCLYAHHVTCNRCINLLRIPECKNASMQQRLTLPIPLRIFTAARGRRQRVYSAHWEAAVVQLPGCAEGQPVQAPPVHHAPGAAAGAGRPLRVAARPAHRRGGLPLGGRSRAM